MKPMSEPALSTYSYLALGDSYTIGASVTPEESYPHQLTAALQKQYGWQNSGLKVIAQTGWTTTNLISAEHSAQLVDTFDVVSLLIGVNNQFQGKDPDDYHTEFIMLLDTAIQRAGGRKDKVFIISIPDYGYTPFGANNQARISVQIDIFNAINKQVADSAGIAYFDITPISREGLNKPYLIASDGLHPSGVMYELWVELMIQKVAEIIAKP